MASKRGLALTGVILAAITGASFAIWLPGQQGPDTTFVITDYEAYLDGAAGIHEVLRDSLHLKYQGLLDGSVLPAEYDRAADRTASQATAQISEFVTSRPPAEWESSYVNYMEAMRSFNSYIVETKVLSSAIADGSDTAGAMARIAELQAESAMHADASMNARP